VNKVLKISEAATLAMHAMLILVQNPGKLISTHQIADTLKVSEAHLSKVLQRLSKSGYVTSIRGPGGGFSLARNPDEVSLLEIFEEIEGPLQDSGCLFAKPVCDGVSCMFGGMLQKVSAQVRQCLEETKLTKIANTRIATERSTQWPP